MSSSYLCLLSFCSWSFPVFFTWAFIRFDPFIDGIEFLTSFLSYLTVDIWKTNWFLCVGLYTAISDLIVSLTVFHGIFIYNFQHVKIDRFTASFPDESRLFLFSYWIDLARPSTVALLNISSTSEQVCLNSKNFFGFTHEDAYEDF